MTILHKFNQALRLSRRSLFLIGLAVIVAAFFIQRTTTYIRSDFTQGILVCENVEHLKYYEADMILYYYVGTEEYSVKMFTQTERAYRPLTVRYLKKQPHRGHVYTIRDYWFVSMWWLLLPVMLWGAFVFALLADENGELELRFSKRYAKKISSEKASEEKNLQNHIAEK